VGVDAVFSEVSDVKRILLLASAILVIAPATARAQVDLSGFWSNPNFEDVMERIDGPALGDYLGLPLSAAGRRAAEAWDASILSIKEHQCQDYPADYQSNSTWAFDMWKDVDPVTHDIMAWRTRLQYMAPERTIWMDGRPHPDEEAPHTWEGFSTGRWEGGSLIVTTTHLKTTWLRRNGVPRSDKATVVERFTKHGNYLSVVTTVYDPVYLTEPYVRSRDMILNPLGSAGIFVCEPAEESTLKPGVIPHVLPGENKFLTEFTVQDGVPVEAARGGAETLYPEYRTKLATLPIPGAPAPAVNTRPQTPSR
jgi:hypothetical protein